MGSHVQTSFLLGERKTNDINSQEYYASVNKLNNYYVLKNGSLRKRAGTVVKNVFNKDVGVIKAIEALDDFYIILTEDKNVHALLRNNRIVNLNLTTFRQHIYNLEGTEMIGTGYEIPSITPTEVVNKTIGIRKALNKIWVLQEDELPFVCEINEQGNLSVRPYFLDIKNTKNYRDIVRAYPIDPVEVEFDPLLEDPSFLSKLVISHNAHLNDNRCKAWLAIDDEAINSGQPIKKTVMGLQKFIGRPLYFNVLPQTLHRVKPEITRQIKTNEMDDTVTFDYIQNNNYSNPNTYDVGILSNLNNATGIEAFEYREIYDDNTTSIGTKTTVINELLYGRKYMVIPNRIVDELPAETNPQYSDAYPEGEVITPAVQETTLTSQDLDFQDLFLDATDGGKIDFSLENVNPKYTTESMRVNGIGYTYNVPLVGVYPRRNGIYLEYGIAPRSNNQRQARGYNNYINLPTPNSTYNFKMNGKREDSAYVYIQIYIRSNSRGTLRVSFIRRTGYGYNSSDRQYNKSKKSMIDSATSTATNNELGYFRDPSYNLPNSSALQNIAAEVVYLSLNTEFRRQYDAMYDLARDIQRNSRGVAIFTGPAAATLPIYWNLVSDEPRLLGAVVNPFASGQNATFGYKIAGRLDLKYTIDGTEETRNILLSAAPESQLTPDNRANNLRSYDFIKGIVFSGNRLTFLTNIIQPNSPPNLLEFVSEVATATIGSSNYTNPRIATHTIEDNGAVIANYVTIEFTTSSAFTGTTGTMTFKDASDTVLNIDIVPKRKRVILARGFNKIVNGTYLTTSDTRTINTRVLQTLGSIEHNEGGLVEAIGWVKLDNDRFSYFIHAKDTNNVITSETTITLIIGTERHTLTKQGVNVKGGVAFINPAGVENAPDLSTNINFQIELTAALDTVEQVLYDFVASETTHRVSKIYAECTIFEIGMPSPAIVDGIRTIGGNNYDLKENNISSVFQAIQDPIKDVININEDVVFATKNKILNSFDKYFTNDPVVLLSLSSTQERDRLISGTGYTPAVFNNVNVDPIHEYIDYRTNLKTLSNGDQRDSIVEYLEGINNDRVSRIYTKDLVDVKGQDIIIKQITPSFDGRNIYSSTNTGVYAVEFNSTKPTVLISNQDPLYKLITFNNKITYLNSNNLIVTEVSSRERLGIVSTYSGSAQQHLLNNIVDLAYLSSYNIYVLVKSDGSIICATDFDKAVEGYSTWTFDKVENSLGNKIDRIKVRRLINNQDKLQALVDYNEFNSETGLFDLKNGIVEFDFSIAEDIQGAITESQDKVLFTCNMTMHNYVDNQRGGSSIFERAYISRVVVNEDNLDCIVRVESQNSKRDYDLKKVSSLLMTKSITPLKLSQSASYYNRVSLIEKNDVQNTLIHGVLIGGNVGD